MRRLLGLTFLALLVACGGQPVPPASSAQGAQRAPGAPASETKPRVVFLGDSLTAGLGLASDESFPGLIGKRLEDRGHDFEVVNAGVSGDTSAGGLRRAEWSLDGDVRVLVLALGANDGLRGLPPDELKKNLAAILDRAAARRVPVILAGMEAPPNNGVEYTRAFRQVYADLSREYKVRFVPFLLQGVAGDRALNQADGIHPNARGAEIVADLVWAELEPVLWRPTDQIPSLKPQAPSPR